MAGGGKTYDLEYTPTWIVGVVCSVMVILSFLFERALHYLGKSMEKMNLQSLYEAVLKVKEELMLLGFISLLLSAFQGPLDRICIPSSYLNHMLPCRLQDNPRLPGEETGRFQVEVVVQLIDDTGTESPCKMKGKVQLLSLAAIHQLHLFIFVLAITHVVLSAVTVCLGGLKIRQWKSWADSIPENADNDPNTNDNAAATATHACSAMGDSSWLWSFVKQFYSSVTRSDYITLYRGFQKMHCEECQPAHFCNCMVDAYEDDFEKVVGIRLYLWGIFVLCLVADVGGWPAFFWITLVPLVLLLTVGTKLEHIITLLVKDIDMAKAATATVVELRDDHFWFNKPRLVLHLIHFILFLNAFQIAAFFWLWVTYGFHSCIMEKLGFVITRLLFGVIIQVLCSFSTLPLYALVTQMWGSREQERNDRFIEISPFWRDTASNPSAQNIPEERSPILRTPNTV